MSDPVKKLEATIKWMTNRKKWCYVCTAKTTHEFGVRYKEDGTEEAVQSCLRCHTLTEEPKS
jgi:hypothetical protein